MIQVKQSKTSTIQLRVWNIGKLELEEAQKDLEDEYEINHEFPCLTYKSGHISLDS
jgi:hypothetical protein